jgi:hypothetical protein
MAFGLLTIALIIVLTALFGCQSERQPTAAQSLDELNRRLVRRNQELAEANRLLEEDIARLERGLMPRNPPVRPRGPEEQSRELLKDLDNMCAAISKSAEVADLRRELCGDIFQ